MSAVTRKRHLAKAVSWRVVGTLDTFLLGWLLSGSVEIGAAIGGAEVLTKTFLYYFHERAWYNHITFGLDPYNKKF